MLLVRVGADYASFEPLQRVRISQVTRLRRGALTVNFGEARWFHQRAPASSHQRARRLGNCPAPAPIYRLFGTTTAKSRQVESGYTYKIAAAYCGKTHNFDPNKHYFSYDQQNSCRKRAGRVLADSNFYFGQGRLASGQDACFASVVGHIDAVSFGVADGVGGWQDAGIDSAGFAHGICMYMEEAAQAYQDTAPAPAPIDLLKIAYEKVCKDKSIQGGGSTACIAVADELGNLNIANLGDSGFIQMRRNKVHHYSDPQTHAFNTPYQLAQIPPKILAQIEEFGGGAPFSDTPGDAGVTELSLKHGDVLVFATDGIWDNLSSQDLLSIVSERMEDCHAWEDGGVNGTQVGKLLPQLTEDKPQGQGRKSLHELLAIEIVQTAKEASMSRKRDGPFAKAFQRVYPEERYTGGKPDDIAVVVAIPLDAGYTPAISQSQKSQGKLSSNL